MRGKSRIDEGRSWSSHWSLRFKRATTNPCWRHIGTFRHEVRPKTRYRGFTKAKRGTTLTRLA